MNEERLRILQMVAEGKVSPDEAARLLEAVEPAERRGPFAGGPPLPPGEPLPPQPPLATLHGPGGAVLAFAGGGPARGRLSRLRLVAQDHNGNSMKVPLALISSRTLPGWVRELCGKCGVDLEGLTTLDPALFDENDDNLFHVETGDGDEIKIEVVR